MGKQNEDSMAEKTEHFKALVQLKIDDSSAIADHTKTTGLNIKWDHIEIAVCVLLNWLSSYFLLYSILLHVVKFIWPQWFRFLL